MAARALDLPLLVPGIRLDQNAAAESARALTRASQPWLAGFLVFGGRAEQVAALSQALRARAGRPIFIASDMERGGGQQVEGLAHLPDLGIYGLAATPEEVEDLGQRTAREALSVGVDVLFAPVLDVRSEPDNPIVGNRSFGWDPARVARLGAAYCRGALAGGAAPVGKHVPGHGATTDDSHDAVPIVRENRTRLIERDLLPFAAALAEGGCPALMTAHVAYPALDPSGAIATFSAPILAHVRALAPDPDLLCLFCDALLMAGALGAGSEAAAGRAALRAGCDALLYPEEPEQVAAGFFDVPEAGPLRAAGERALARVRGLLGRIAIARAEAGGAGQPEADTPFEVARRALALAGGASLARERRWVVVLDDDDVPQRGRVLAERGREAGVAVSVVRVPQGEEAPEALLAGGPFTVVVMASVRAWKGASGVSPALLARLEGLLAGAQAGKLPAQTLWLAPRAARAGLHLPGTGPDVERAVAERLFG